MGRNLLQMKNKIITFILCMICIFPLTSCGENSTIKNNPQPKIINVDKPFVKYVDIYDVIKEAFVTDKEYANGFSQHMTERVFKYTNYKKFPVHIPKFIKPFKIDFSLKEIYQTKDNENNLIYVDMIYSMKVIDANNEIVGGGLNIPVTYTVKLTDNGWYIIDRYERP